MYPPELVAPMKKEMLDVGFEELHTPEQVDNVLHADGGTALLFINSVCGCSAGSARPAVRIAVTNEAVPDKLVMVFAGVDTEATERARKYLLPYPPSSPSIALFKDGRLVHMLERHHIEGNPPEAIAENLAEAFNAYC